MSYDYLQEDFEFDNSMNSNVNAIIAFKETPLYHFYTKKYEKGQYKPFAIELTEANMYAPIMLFPYGTFNHPIYGKLKFNDKFFTEIMENFSNKVRKIQPFIDEQHNEGKALGWITYLYLDEKGMWADIDWNEDGVNLIKKGSYKYISPWFGDYVDEESGQEYSNVLYGAALTNRPFLKVMPPIQLSEDGKEQEKCKILYFDDLESQVSEKINMNEIRLLIESFNTTKDKEIKNALKIKILDYLNFAKGGETQKMNTKEKKTQVETIGKTDKIITDEEREETRKRTTEEEREETRKRVADGEVIDVKRKVIEEEIYEIKRKITEERLDEKSYTELYEKLKELDEKKFPVPKGVDEDKVKKCIKKIKGTNPRTKKPYTDSAKWAICVAAQQKAKAEETEKVEEKIEKPKKEVVVEEVKIEKTIDIEKVAKELAKNVKETKEEIIEVEKVEVVAGKTETDTIITEKVVEEKEVIEEVVEEKLEEEVDEKDKLLQAKDREIRELKVEKILNKKLVDNKVLSEVAKKIIKEILLAENTKEIKLEEGEPVDLLIAFDKLLDEILVIDVSTKLEEEMDKPGDTQTQFNREITRIQTEHKCDYEKAMDILQKEKPELMKEALRE